MSMDMCVLGSGSSGNCTAVRIGGRLVLIDAGFGPRTVARRLAGSGLALRHIHALLLTHLDRDHFNPAWFAALHRLGIRLYCHQRHLHALYRHRSATASAADAHTLHRAGLLFHFTDEPFHIDPAGPCPIAVRPLPLAHDRNGTFGFRLRADRAQLGYATDLGRVPAALIETFTDVDLLAIESNYDPPMQLASARPAVLKRRIMNGRGHLSNRQAFEAVRRIVRRSGRPPRHIVLLHLSRQCNRPDLARAAFEAEPRLAHRLHLSHQTQPTPWLSALTPRQTAHAEQLAMFT